MSIYWSSPNLIAKKILFIDGMTRAGKSMLCPIVSTFEKTYPFQQQIILDNLIPLIRTNSISLSAATALLKIFFNESIYFLNISRQVNFRKDDNTSLVKSKDYKIFLKNLNKKEGDYVINEIKKKNYLPIFMTHNLLGSINHFKKLNIPFQMLYIYRHPIDNVFSLVNRYKKISSREKFLSNFNNPRLYSIMIKKYNYLMPSFALFNEKYFMNLNNAEKYAFYYLLSINDAIQKYKEYKKKKNILLINYDDFGKDTQNQIKSISNFISLKPTTFLKKSLRLNNLPRKIDYNKRIEKKSILNKFIRKELYNNIIALSEKYEKKILFL